MLVRRATADDAAGIARVHVDCWRTTYRGMIPQPFLDGLSYEASEKRSREYLANDTLFAFVALHSNEIVGFAYGGPARNGDVAGQGELTALYVLLEYQKQGVGRDLVRSIARELAARDMSSMLVWVLAQNPARRFYEAMGGRYLRQQMIQIGDTPIEEVAYEWRDIRELAGGDGPRAAQPEPGNQAT